MDVRLKRDASLRATVGHVDVSGTDVPVAILDTEWQSAGLGEKPEPSDPIANAAAGMAAVDWVADGKPPAPAATAGEIEYLRVERRHLDAARLEAGE